MLDAAANYCPANLGSTASESLNCFSTRVGRPKSTAPNHTTKIAAILRPDKDVRHVFGMCEIKKEVNESVIA